MRIATYNVEWFSSLFGDEDELLKDDGWSARFNVTRAQQIAALGVVFTALNADAIMIIEAPDTSKKANAIKALEGFSREFGLRARRAVTGFANDTQQEIALLYDPDVIKVYHDPQSSFDQQDGPEAPPFDGVFRIDLDIDATQDKVTFSKPPLELAVETALGFKFRMIGAHLKSKAPHGARTDQEAMRMSIANRRKQLAQAIWLRRRIKAILAAQTPLMVLGDLNDGPGLDEYEHLFGQSSVEIILGQTSDTGKLFDPHAQRALQRKLGATQTTARFWIRKEKRFLQALLDYIMVSPEFRTRDPKWRIWHPLDDPDCWASPDLRDALVTASDHFPVTLEVDV